MEPGHRRQRAGKGLKDSNLGAGSTKLFRASGFHLLASWALRRPVRFGAGAARKWDREFESGFLQQRVCCELDNCSKKRADQKKRGHFLCRSDRRRAFPFTCIQTPNMMPAPGAALIADFW
jgi:hypothetical protein